MIRRCGARAWAAGLTGMLVLGLAGCTTGPSTEEEVCAQFDALGAQLLQGNTFGNSLFDRIDDLAGTAQRYPDADIKQEGEKLAKLADAKSVSGAQLQGASQRLANICGGPLGLKAMFGGGDDR